MRGRSNVVFIDDTKGITRDLKEEAGCEELEARAEWLRGMIHDHGEMGNKLINVARRMIVIAANKNDKAKAEINRHYNSKTLEAYRKTAEERSKKKDLSERQKQ